MLDDKGLEALHRDNARSIGSALNLAFMNKASQEQLDEAADHIARAIRSNIDHHLAASTPSGGVKGLVTDGMVAAAQEVLLKYVEDEAAIRRALEAALASPPHVAGETEAEPVGYVTAEALRLMLAAKPEPGWHYHVFSKVPVPEKSTVALYASPPAPSPSEVEPK